MSNEANAFPVTHSARALTAEPVDLSMLSEAKKLMSSARPLAQGILAIGQLLELAPELNRVLTSLQGRRDGLAQEIEALAKEVEKQTHFTASLIASEQVRRQKAVDDSNSQIAGLDAATRMAQTASKADLAKLAQKMEEANGAHLQKLATLADVRQAAEVAHAGTIERMSAEVKSARERRDAILADIDALKAKHLG